MKNSLLASSMRGRFVNIVSSLILKAIISQSLSENKSESLLYEVYEMSFHCLWKAIPCLPRTWGPPVGGQSLSWPSLPLHVYFNQNNGRCGIHLDPGSHRIGFAGQSDSEDIESHVLCSSAVIAGISQSSSEVPVSVLPLGRIPSSDRDPCFPCGFLTPAYYWTPDTCPIVMPIY